MAKSSKTNMEILEEIRTSRNNTIQELGDNSIFITKVEDLGKGQNTGKEIYRLVEEKYLEEDPETGETKKEIREFFYEYDGEPKLIGFRNNNPEIAEEIIPVGFDGDKEKDWNSTRDDIEQCLEEREKMVKAIAKELGISVEDIDNLSEIELSQKIDELEIDEEEIEEEEEKQNENEPQEISETEMKNIGMQTLNEVSLNAQVDSKGTSLGDVLNMDGYEKIVVVHSYKLAELTNENGEKGKVNNMGLSLLAQKSDGTYETIPETKLKQYRGDNRRVTEIDDNETIKSRNEDCMFEIPGQDKKIVINRDYPFNTYLSENTRDNNGNMAQKIQGRREGTRSTDVEVRNLFTNKGIDKTYEMKKELEEHEKTNCKEVDIKEVDGNKETGHKHYNPDLQEHINAIEDIMKRGKVSKEEAEIKFEKQLEENEEITVEQATDNAVEEIEEEYGRTFPSEHNLN